MAKGYKVIDADGHIGETNPGAVDWEKALPDEYKALAPKRVPFDTGGGRMFMEGKLWPRTYLYGRAVDAGDPIDIHRARPGV